MAEIVTHHEELEIDLLQQGHDLLDFWRGTVTPRRMRLLMRTLPANGAAIAKVDPETAAAAAWGATDHLLADLWDLLFAINAESPQRHPRPLEAWQKQKRDEAVTAFLEAQAERNRQRDREAGIH